VGEALNEDDDENKDVGVAPNPKLPDGDIEGATGVIELTILEEGGAIVELCVSEEAIEPEDETDCVRVELRLLEGPEKEITMDKVGASDRVEETERKAENDGVGELEAVREEEGVSETLILME